MAEGSPSRIIKIAENKQVEIIASPAILAEINRVLRYERIMKILNRSGRDVSGLMDMILRLSSIVNVKFTVSAIREDPADNMVLACARQARADFIVSGDRHLLQVGEYGKTRIVSASRLLDMLRLD